MAIEALSNIGVGVGKALNVAFYFVIFVLAIGVTIFFVWINSFKHKVRIREIANDKVIIFDDRAKEVQEDGVYKWKLFRKKVTIPIPSLEVIDIDTKGKKVVEVYTVGKGHWAYMKDNIFEHIVEERDKDGNIKYVKSFKPISTNAQIMMANQIIKANSRDKKKWIEHIIPLAAITSLTIIVVALLIFYGKVAEPAIESHRLSLESQKVNLEIQRENKDITALLQRTLGSNNIPTDLPSTSSKSIAKPE